MKTRSQSSFYTTLVVLNSVLVLYNMFEWHSFSSQRPSGRGIVQHTVELERYRRKLHQLIGISAQVITEKKVQHGN